MDTFEAATAEQQERAAKRVTDAAERRHDTEATLAKGNIALADTPQRVAARLDRLSRYHGEVQPVDPTALAEQDPTAVADASRMLEKIIGTEDYVHVRYLDAGVLAAKAVGRVSVRDVRGRVVGFGTGSLVSTQLLLTNHHVLTDAAVAGRSVVEFDFQDGLDGLPLPTVTLGLDPDRLFLADEDLDYALVALKATPEELAAFGWNPVIEAEGKAILGDFVTIVQHPSGEKKRVALRDNQVVGLPGDFMHYRADTKPGSSGSPVFNDQWEVVALHHAGVPAPGHPGEFVNEGVRISRVVADIRRRAAELPAAAQALITAMLAFSNDERTTVATAPATPTAPALTPAGVAAGAQAAAGTHAAAAALAGTAPEATAEAEADGTVRVTIPLEVRLRAGTAASGGEAVAIDPDYANRRGYDPDFLGTGPLSVPLPTVTGPASDDALPPLPYHHFSVVMNRARRLAAVTAVNIDGATSMRLARERDRWTFDPRLPADQQTGEEVYRDNPLDRGHLVRRLDPAWGAGQAEAKLANDDTFHFTNCTPQHADFNQEETTWQGLEDYVLDHADNRDLRVSVLTGPVLAEDDDEYRGVQLPRQYWKVVAMVRKDGTLSATAYLLSQEALLQGLEAAEDFSYGAYRTFQVPVRRVAALTSLDLGRLPAADPLDAPATPLESLAPPVPITGLSQVVL
jgi:endonuclease G